MKTQVLAIVSLMTLASARPLSGSRALRLREVPQEHSHEKYITSVRTSLALNNPDAISDPVFGLLGNAAAAGGQGKIADPDCLQQATADQAFTNAKAAGDTQSMIDALIFQALERNTASVGTASKTCTSIKPVNSEIAAIQRHQDPTSAGAADINKASTLAVAQQIQALGGNITQALDAGTFSPGTVGDPTAAGNTCDDANDTTGCIFTQGKLVQDFTPDELATAVASGSTGATSTASNSTSTSTTSTASTGAAAAADECSSSTSNSSSAAAAAPAASDAAAASSSATPSATTTTTSAVDLGSCASAPLITFGAGFDGRTENSFEFEDLSTFNHGSADNIPVLTGFAVQQLQDKCKASADTVSAAQAAKTSADALSSQGQAAADAWNSAFQ